MRASRLPGVLAARCSYFMLVAIALSALFAVVTPVRDGIAADSKQADRERAAAISRAQEAVRKVEREKAALMQEKKTLQEEQSKLESSVKEAEARAEAAGKALAQSRRSAQVSAKELEDSRKEKTQLTANIDVLRAQVQKLTDERNAALKTVEIRDADLGKLRTVAQARARVLGVCEEKNTKLYQVSVDLIERFESHGFWDSVRAAEPFTRQKRVDLENLMEAYRDKVRAERTSSLPGQ